MPNLALSAETVCEGLTVQAAAKQFSAAHTTFQRHLDDHKISGNEQLFYSNKRGLWTVFLTEEEDKLTDYIIPASDIHYGLTRSNEVSLSVCK
jgi:hypothetical protein